MSDAMSDYTRYVRPLQGEQLRLLGLDWRFETGHADRLTGLDPHGRRRDVLDLLGGFGTSLFGHTPLEFQEHALNFFAQSRVMQAQLSQRQAAGQAAKILSEILHPLFQSASVVHWANSGSEAVEIALKHSLLRFQNRKNEIRRRQQGLWDQVQSGHKTFRASATYENIAQALWVQNQKLNEAPCVLVLERAYHGRTLMALSASHSPLQRHLPADLGLDKVALDPADFQLWGQRTEGLHGCIPVLASNRDEVWVEDEDFSRVTAVLFEPIQGEGGLYPISPVQAQELQRLARAWRADLIVDEIQSGMGRSGQFCACESLGIRPDVVVLAKALGAGVAKVGAVAIAQAIYEKDLGRFGSTFAEDDFSCSVAALALRQACTPVHLERCARTGRIFLDRLQDLVREFPDVLCEARGRGLMLGLEFKNWRKSPSNLLRLFAGNQLDGFLMASFLLNRHDIRVAPSLSHPSVLRFEPSVKLDPQQIDSVIAALRTLCEDLRRGDFAALTQHLWDPEFQVQLPEPRDFRDHPRASRFDESTDPVDCRIGFFGHLLRFEDIINFDPSMAGIPRAQIESWYKQGEGFFRPTLFDRVHIKGSDGKILEVNIIGLYETPETMIRSYRARRDNLVLERIQQGVDLAAKLGCEVMGLGGLTSVITRNGLKLDSRGMTLTTGNALTLAMSCQALEALAAQTQLPLKNARVAVVGATGNIGEAAVHWLRSRAGELLLVGRLGQGEALQIQMKSLLQSSPDVGSGAKLDTTTDMMDIKNCDFILCATNAPGYVVGPEHMSRRVRGILDVATPSDVDPDVQLFYPAVHVIQGGWVKVPGLRGILGAAFPTPEGHTLACLAETMILGLRQETSHFSYGELEFSKVEKIASWAKELGFALGAGILPGDVEKDLILKVKRTSNFVADLADSLPHEQQL